MVMEMISAYIKTSGHEQSVFKQTNTSSVYRITFWSEWVIGI